MPELMRAWLGALLALACVSPALATAATYTAPSCENKVGQTDVQNTIDNQATVAGDIVVLPAGSCNWTKKVTLPTTRHIQLRGTGSMPAIGAATSSGTTIRWTVDAAGGDISAGGSYIEVSEVTTGNPVISNITFVTDSIPNITQNGILVLRGCCPSGNWALWPYTGYYPVVLHHLTNTQSFINGSHFVSFSSLRGIYYRNYTYNTPPGILSGNTGPTLQCAGSDPANRDSWMAASTFGTNDTTGLLNLYVESSTFENIGGALDLDSGCRAVVRYNTFIDSSIADHGNDSSWVGIRHVEIYNNEFRCVNEWNIQGHYLARGGTSVITDNIAPVCYGGSRPRWGATVQPLRLGDVFSTHYYGFGDPGTTYGNPPVAPFGCFPGPYPWYRQFGWGYSGAGTFEGDGDRRSFDAAQVLEPAYIWNNKNTSGGTPGEADIFSVIETAGTCVWPAGSGIAPTGTTTNGSPTITSVSSTAGICGSDTCNVRIAGTGIPASTTVVSVTVNTITMSANATASNSGVTLTVDNNNQTSAGYIQQNREYYLSVAKAGYTKAAYPHALAPVTSDSAPAPTSVGRLGTRFPP